MTDTKDEQPRRHRPAQADPVGRVGRTLTGRRLRQLLSLYDQPGRLQANVATVLLAWFVLAGLCVVFAQLTQLMRVIPPDVKFTQARAS